MNIFTEECYKNMRSKSSIFFHTLLTFWTNSKLTNKNNAKVIGKPEFYLALPMEDGKNIIIETKSRPLFKGFFHLIIFIIYICGFKHLTELIPSTCLNTESSLSILALGTAMGEDLRILLTSYLITELVHFGCSSLLHLINWSKEIEVYPRRLDHIMIFLKIMTTYYAVISTVLTDINPLVVRIICIGTLLGILSRIFFTDAPEWLIALPYFITGWAILLDPRAMISLIYRVPFGALLCLIGGILYSIGGFIYIKKCPNLFPTYFEYHELFHIFNIMGTLSFTVFIFKHAIPYYTYENNC